MAHVNMWEKVFQAEGTVCEKALKQDNTQCV